MRPRRLGEAEAIRKVFEVNPKPSEGKILEEVTPWRTRIEAVRQSGDELVHPNWLAPELLCLGAAVLPHSPKHARAYFERAIAVTANGKREERHLEGLCGLANALIALSDPEAAEAHLLAAEKLHQKLSDSLTALWRQLYSGTGRPTETERLIDGARPDLVVLEMLLVEEKDELKALRERQFLRRKDGEKT